MNPVVRKIAEAVKEQGGRAVLVGGYVRDHILGLDPKDNDIEVFGLSLDKLETLLKRFGNVHAVGRSFGVLKVGELDISVPRRDSKTGKGHKGFLVEPDPTMSFEEASLRRDFTINSMGMDPLTGEILDPHQGQEHVRSRTLQVTDAKTFVEDPLRVLRGAQFIARFELKPAKGVVDLCLGIKETLKELAAERLWDEWVKLMRKGVRPSLGMQFMYEAGVTEILFPEIHVLAGCRQDPAWHPEGDVFIHTGMALDAAAEMRTGDSAHDLQLMFGVLCHDFGKPATTAFERGHWRSPNHEPEGVAPTRSFLERMRAPVALIDQVVALVNHHLAPAHFTNPKSNAGPRAYRRLAHKLMTAGTNIEMLARVSRADHFGRTTENALKRVDPTGDEFLEKARNVHVAEKAEEDVVKGRHLLERGLKPGPEIGRILESCREIQYELGLTEPEEILRKVLGDER